MWAYGRGQTDTHTDTQTRVTTIHFASSTTHAKCNSYVYNSVTAVKAFSVFMLKVAGAMLDLWVYVEPSIQSHNPVGLYC